MTTTQLTVPAPKEIVDVYVALDALVQKIMAKETAIQIAVDELTTAVGLAGEMTAIPGDVAGALDQCIDASALYGRRILYRLINQPVTPVVTQV